MGELYGEVNPQTFEWHDGLMATIVRECVRVSFMQCKYVLAISLSDLLRTSHRPTTAYHPMHLAHRTLTFLLTLSSVTAPPPPSIILSFSLCLILPPHPSFSYHCLILFPFFPHSIPPPLLLPCRTPLRTTSGLFVTVLWMPSGLRT